MTPQEGRAAIASRLEDLTKGRPRTVIAVAGPPASGKSTFAETIAEEMRNRNIAASVVPMDGFHLDNSVLRQRGLLARKGAPETFDAEGFVALVSQLKQGGAVSYPLFDRHTDATVANAGHIDADCTVVIVEGNYLLFNEPPWDQLGDLWDLSVRVDVPMDTLRDRLVKRWIDHGMAATDALTRAESNDLPNARRVRQAALPADLVITNAG